MISTSPASVNPMQFSKPSSLNLVRSLLKLVMALSVSWLHPLTTSLLSDAMTWDTSFMAWSETIVQFVRFSAFESTELRAMRPRSSSPRSTAFCWPSMLTTCMFSSSCVCSTIFTTASWFSTVDKKFRFLSAKNVDSERLPTMRRKISAATRTWCFGDVSVRRWNFRGYVDRFLSDICGLSVKARLLTAMMASKVSQKRSANCESTGMSVRSSVRPLMLRCSFSRRIALSTFCVLRFAVYSSCTCSERQRLWAYRESMLRSFGAMASARLKPSAESL
mmetsp:Transcript_25850/g.80943  ORF Transcript_25850/g.80943 Transcript_25850/m.80943 type:complete len:277 (-) Transcript_25850:2320-3150(-)